MLELLSLFFCVSVSRNWRCQTTNRIPCGERWLLPEVTAAPVCSEFVPLLWTVRCEWDVAFIQIRIMENAHTIPFNIFGRTAKASHAMQIHCEIWFLFILLFIPPFENMFLFTLQRWRREENWVTDSFRIWNCFCWWFLTDGCLLDSLVCVCVVFVVVVFVRASIIRGKSRSSSGKMILIVMRLLIESLPFDYSSVFWMSSTTNNFRSTSTQIFGIFLHFTTI